MRRWKHCGQAGGGGGQEGEVSCWAGQGVEGCVRPWPRSAGDCVQWYRVVETVRVAAVDLVLLADLQLHVVLAHLGGAQRV
jgi:hypothetical protein